jgi:nicotinate-nucleotide pyrophosphorylase (carboxylating)
MTEINNARALIQLAIAEDIGDGDFSARSAVPSEAENRAALFVKEACILAGIDVAQWIFETIDPNLTLEILMRDGETAKTGDIAFRISGRVHSILQAERLVLNFMQRMSGIATKTAQYVDAIAHTDTKILDTRKTTPGMRYFEKWAVRIGGGHNHRMGLYDMIMLKDNHIDYAGGIAHGIAKCKEYMKLHNLKLPIEVEARNLIEVKEILEAGPVDRIMFDNFSPDDTKLGVSIVGRQAETESSGGITLKSIASYAECGVDYISVGALTHHIQSVDLSLKAY